MLKKNFSLGGWIFLTTFRRAAKSFRLDVSSVKYGNIALTYNKSIFLFCSRKQNRNDEIQAQLFDWEADNTLHIMKVFVCTTAAFLSAALSDNHPATSRDQRQTYLLLDNERDTFWKAMYNAITLQLPSFHMSIRMLHRDTYMGWKINFSPPTPNPFSEVIGSANVEINSNICRNNFHIS